MINNQMHRSLDRLITNTIKKPFMSGPNQLAVCIKDTNIKIRKTEFIYICASKNGSSSSTVKTGEVWGDVSRTQKMLSMSC